MDIRSAFAATVRAMNAADIETLLDSGDYGSGSRLKDDSRPVNRKVVQMMTSFAKGAVADGWNAEAAYEAFAELIDDENDGLEEDERLGVPRFRTFRKAFALYNTEAEVVH